MTYVFVIDQFHELEFPVGPLGMGHILEGSAQFLYSYVLLSHTVICSTGKGTKDYYHHSSYSHALSNKSIETFHTQHEWHPICHSGHSIHPHRRGDYSICHRWDIITVKKLSNTHREWQSSTSTPSDKTLIYNGLRGGATCLEHLLRRNGKWYGMKNDQQLCDLAEET